MYKADGSFYVGHFNQGVAEGKGHYIFANGDYYQGEMVSNHAQCKNGVFKTAHSKYVGGFVNSNFDGQGKETTEDYSYEGLFSQGRRTKGKLTWGSKQNQSVYEGAFDEKSNSFTGVGKLIESKGTYEGTFVNGEKHGNGTYYYKTGIKYIGEYKNGKKSGKGIIYNDDGVAAYDGQFLADLPHGKGKATSTKAGKTTQTFWIQGIEKQAYQELERAKSKVSGLNGVTAPKTKQ